MEIRRLNTLRGLAALIVLVDHYSNYTKLLNKFWGSGAGHLGVMLFFLLSGFLMSYLYLGKEFNKQEVYGYVIARTARVVPLFLIIVLGSYLLIKLGITGVLYDIPNTAVLISNISLLSGSLVMWTIPAEIHFYAFFLCLWLLWAKKKQFMLVLILFLTIVIIYFHYPCYIGDFWGVHYYFITIRILPYFFMGIAFGLLYANWKVPSQLLSRAYVLSLLLILPFYPKIHLILTGLKYKTYKDPGILFSISAVFFMITFLVPDDDVLLSNRIGDFMGKISYSLYLLHMPVIWGILPQATKHPKLFLPVFLLLTIIISYLSYQLIENPLRILIRRIFINNRTYSDSPK